MGVETRELFDRFELPETACGQSPQFGFEIGGRCTQSFHFGPVFLRITAVHVWAVSAFFPAGICLILGSCYLRETLRRTARGGVYPLRAARVIFFLDDFAKRSASLLGRGPIGRTPHC